MGIDPLYTTLKLRCHPRWYWEIIDQLLINYKLQGGTLEVICWSEIYPMGIDPLYTTLKLRCHPRWYWEIIDQLLINYKLQRVVPWQQYAGKRVSLTIHIL